MKLPLISCIVPVFNGERYLREALDSIVKQTYRSIEIIVADDGSTDGTAALVASYGDKLRYLFQPNGGTASACNLGVQGSRGDFIAFLAVDDLWHPEKLARQIARFQLRSNLDACVCYVQNFWIPELKEEADRFRNHRIAQPLPGYVPQALLAKRAIFDTVGHFDPALRHADSTDWFVRAMEHGAVVELIADVLVFRRLHRTNLSRQMAAASRQEYLQIMRKILNRRRQNATSR